jgi:purine-cytosine permease-like protein
VIISAPMSYAGSAQRIMRIRRRAPAGWKLVTITFLAILFVLAAWFCVTVWYLAWGLWLVPYRLLRRGARKRKAEAIRHRELMGTIQGSAAASAAAIVAATAAPQLSAIEPLTVYSPSERIADADREKAIEQLREHMLAGRLNADEFEDRLGTAHKARTRAELDAARTDLP